MHDETLKKLLQQYKAPRESVLTPARVRQVAARQRQPSPQAEVREPVWDWPLAGYTLAFSLLMAVVIGLALGYGTPDAVSAAFSSNGISVGGIAL